MVRWRAARRGLTWHGRQGTSRQGSSQQGRQDGAWLGVSRHVPARLGWARQARQGAPGFGEAGRGMAWQGGAGSAWLGPARRGAAGLGKAGHGRRCALMADLRTALTEIYQARGELTPQIVVDEARPKNAPLHDRFEWNDKLAGEAYRRVQAQALIRTVKLEFTSKSTGERMSIRAWQSVREAGDAEREGYAPTEEIVQDDVSLKILLRQCEREIGDVKRKYGHLNEFADLMRAAIA